VISHLLPQHLLGQRRPPFMRNSVGLFKRVIRPRLNEDRTEQTLGRKGSRARRPLAKQRYEERTMISGPTRCSFTGPYHLPLGTAALGGETVNFELPSAREEVVEGVRGLRER